MEAARTSLAGLVDRHRPEILAYLIRLLGNPHDAQDVCQETFLRAHRAFARLGPDANSRAWLYRIATNTAHTAARRRGRARSATSEVDVDTLPAHSLASADEREQLHLVARAMHALPTRQRAALVLRRFHDLSYAEIAATVGGSEAAARANVYQAVKKLRAALGGAS
jgi:RNA polymerase sigma-70 factor, ECF subfamily